MFAQRIERLTSSLVRDILAAASRPGMISFAGGLPASEALFQPGASDFAALNCAQYGQTEGEPQLRELIAQRARALGIACTAGQVLILNGSQQGIDLVSKLFVEEGTPLVVEAPAYLAALQSFKLFGAQLRPVTVDAQQGPVWTELADALPGARLCYLTPTFQNPSGYCYTDAERTTTAELLDAADVPLFEDDPYRALSYDGPAPAPIVGRLHKARWVYQSSFSKTLAPGLRLGYLIAHPDLITPLTRLKQAADLHSNRFSQHLVANLLASNRIDPHVAAALPLYQKRRAAMDAALRTHLADKATWQLPQGGLFFWLKLNQPTDTYALMQQALEAGVAVMPGDAFYQGVAPGSYLRLNFSHANETDIATGVARLAALLG